MVFSKELALGHWGGSRREELTVYSITNTLTGIPWVEGVRIEIGGGASAPWRAFVAGSGVFTNRIL